MSEEIEEWRPVVGFEGKYEASSLGRIKSLPRLAWNGSGMKPIRERILKPGVCKNGYWRVVLGLGNGRTVHRLVAEAFLGKSHLDVNHKDGNKSNNSIKNLEFISHLENVRHGLGLGLKKNFTSQRGEKNPHAKLREEDAIKILEMRWCCMGVREIAEMTGYSIHSVRQICYGGAWKHISREFKWQPIVLTPLVNS